MAVLKELKDFVEVHGVQMLASGIPPSLHRLLFDKLSSEKFDGGDYFEIRECEGGRQRMLVLSCDDMPKESNIFLIDHAWSFRLTEARKQLEEIPGLAERMGRLMRVLNEPVLESFEKVTPESEKALIDGSPRSVQERIEMQICRVQEENQNIEWLELDELEIDDNTLTSLDLPSRFMDLVGLSLWGNKLETVDAIIGAISKLSRLRALWLNENPVTHNYGNTLRNALVQHLRQLEIYNSCFTENYTSWALGFCAGIYCADNPIYVLDESYPLKDVKELDLSNRDIKNLSNKIFNHLDFPLLTTLNLRGNPLDQNSEDYLFDLLRSFINLQSLEVDIPGPLGSNALKIVESLPRLSHLNGVIVSKILEEEKVVVDARVKPRFSELSNKEQLVDCILQAMWRYLMTYRLADEEKLDETPVWYVMDELGSALRHSDVPNFKVTPFLFLPDGKLTSAISYSVMWPTSDVLKGDECTRDYLPGIGEDKQRSARLTAWFLTPENYFIQVFEKHLNKLKEKRFQRVNVLNASTRSILPSDGRTLRVYTDNEQVEELLNRPEFVLIDDPKNADIIWASAQVDEEFKKSAGLNDSQYINQFPYEACVVMKHYLANTIQQAYGLPEWFQPTYNLETQLAELIGDYHVREKGGENNMWILKPWNMARTIDTTVTAHLPAIIRLIETGPKICQKYIEHPALFKGRKFDLRYAILVRSIQPLEVLIFDVFWVRLANNQYTLSQSSLADYETHFTVMNYGRKLEQVNSDQFVLEFEQEHNVNWCIIHERIKSTIRSVFEAASVVHPEMHCSKARTLYGVDVMLDCNYQPKILEVTYCPDCTRACKYDVKAVVGNQRLLKGSEFFNHVFGSLFLNESVHASIL